MRRAWSWIINAGLVVLLGLAVGLSWAEDHGDSHARAVEEGTATLRVLWVASSGWAETGPEGQPEGVMIALMSRFAQWLKARHDLAVRLEFIEEDDWRRFYARVRDAQGGVFGLGNVTITTERREELAFSPAYAQNVAVLISRADRAEIAQAAAMAEVLDGLDAMAFAGTLHEQRLGELARTHWPGMRMDLAGSNREILEAVAAGTHFAYIDGYNYVRARAEGLALRRHAVLDDPGERFGIIMPLDNDWQPLLKAFFADDGGLTASSWYRSTLERHLGAEIADLMRPDTP